MPKAGATADLVTFNALVNLCREGPASTFQKALGSMCPTSITFAPKYLYTIWVHGPLGKPKYCYLDASPYDIAGSLQGILWHLALRLVSQISEAQLCLCVDFGLMIRNCSRCLVYLALLCLFDRQLCTIHFHIHMSAFVGFCANVLGKQSMECVSLVRNGL